MVCMLPGDRCDVLHRLQREVTSCKSSRLFLSIENSIGLTITATVSRQRIGSWGPDVGGRNHDTLKHGLLPVTISHSNTPKLLMSTLVETHSFVPLQITMFLSPISDCKAAWLHLPYCKATQDWLAHALRPTIH